MRAPCLPLQFRVNGTVFHRIGALLPGAGEEHRFAQIYMLEPARAVDRRLGIMSDLDRGMVERLEAMLRRVNPHIAVFHTARELQREADATGVATARLVVVLDEHGVGAVRNMGGPTGIGRSQVAAFVEGTDAALRSLVVRLRGGGLRDISSLNGMHQTLHFPLLFPSGRMGWRPGMAPTVPQHTPPAAVRRMLSDSITMADYGAFHLQIRTDGFVALQRSGRLLQEYMVDMYIQVESQRLDYIRRHQLALRAEQYARIGEALRPPPRPPPAARAPPPARPQVGADVGRRRTVLPGSFVGGPRDMRSRYADALAIVRHTSKPTYFITMTCNAQWQEILNALRHGERAEDRPDVTSRVFKMKLDQVIKDIKEGRIFGNVRAIVYVIEFQKRGLPHAHILVTMNAEDVPRDGDALDSFISAELPDRDASPEDAELYDLVGAHMLHGPCGPAFPDCPCMKNARCTKWYRKAFAERTTIRRNGWAEYRRRNDGRTFEKRVAGGGTVVMDNQDVVPHNPTLLRKYRCHINVEHCASIKSLKYLFKYVYKGHDRAQVRGAEGKGNGHN